MIMNDLTITASGNYVSITMSIQAYMLASSLTFIAYITIMFSQSYLVGAISMFILNTNYIAIVLTSLSDP